VFYLPWQCHTPGMRLAVLLASRGSVSALRTPLLAIGVLLANCEAAPSSPLPFYHAVAAKPGVVSLTSDGEAVMALLDDGSTWCWGSNSTGECPTSKAGRILGVIRDRVPVCAAQISFGSSTGMAVTRDGRLVMWGREEENELEGDATPYLGMTKEITGLPKMAKAFDGGGWVHALAADGTLYEWGTVEAKPTPFSSPVPTVRCSGTS
jgi:hypothetical protein